ncbi:centrosomal protein of 70 kDa-like [Ruditapes philippinarum]|uniref:centrosomal protein of 70 kDa-like n=1 Tax=Ruditapes philippinarum TaxID=129788 RepID=UPI00295BC7C7|nr:centrosomal protein of 70 kDa-like [Ruditapes philippinarum]
MAEKRGSSKSRNYFPTDDIDSMDANADSVSDNEEYTSVRSSKDKKSDDWSTVNKKLREHGLQPLKFQHPADIHHTSGSMTCLDSNNNKMARENFLSLMSDCDHRQTLVQDLITKNNQLKEDLDRQTELTEKYFSKMKDLKIMLESSRARVKELESDEPGRSQTDDIWDSTERVKNTRSAVVAKNKDLEYKCKQQERELERLKEKLHNMSQQDERRNKRVAEVFQEFRRRTARAHHTMDDKLLDVIDTYERQLQNLQRDLEMYRSGGDMERSEGSGDEGSSFYSVSKEQDTTGNFKKLVRAYEKQIKELNKQVKKLEEEKELIKLDVGARPEVKDYRVAQLRMKKLEKLLALHNISIPGEKLKTDPYRLKRKFSTRLEDLDYIPLDLCHQYLKDIGTELKVKDLETVIPRIQRVTKELEEVHKYEQFCRTVQEVVNSLADNKRKEKLGGTKRSHLSSDTLNHLVTVIENWKEDEEGLQELQMSINRLGDRCAPWLKIRLVGEPTMSQITSAVDKIVYDDGVEEQAGQEHPNRSVLENIVSHFQTLFDVPNISGVFPRMNQIFTKLGEVHNVLNTLKNLLGLGKDVKSSAIVDSVGRLVQQHNTTTVQHLKNLLQTEDLDGVIRRLQEHQEFFPAFYEIMNKLIEILDVRRMDQVIPAVRALKLLAN